MEFETTGNEDDHPQNIESTRLSFVDSEPATNLSLEISEIPVHQGETMDILSSELDAIKEKSSMLERTVEKLKKEKEQSEESLRVLKVKNICLEDELKRLKQSHTEKDNEIRHLKKIESAAKKTKNPGRRSRRDGEYKCRVTRFRQKPFSVRRWR
ncbi:uncharacterized protein LOC141912129 [Tubulanus polymorphus]|uniref:uncharacterized protein LOC141912129 n=1 Tax=Tubulanus polymorphus TaxID=672921 RepID=UPI003DA52B3E